MKEVTEVAEGRVAWLRQAADEGTVHTVRLSFGDHLGAWRGKRIPVRHFLDKHLDAPMGFCDGMIVCDVRCDIIQETPFSNFDTGYPDLHLWPDLEGLREAAWAPGEAMVFGDPTDAAGIKHELAPRQVLRRVVARLAERGFEASIEMSLDGRFMTGPRSAVSWGWGGLGPAEDASAFDVTLDGLVRSGLPLKAGRAGPTPGRFSLTFGPGTPSDIAESVLIAKGACKEIGAQQGSPATFMSRTVGDDTPSRSVVDVSLKGMGGSSLDGSELNGSDIAARLGDVRGLLQPSITAFKAGIPGTPAVGWGNGVVTAQGLQATSEAEPFAAVAACLSAVALGMEGMSPDLGNVPPDLTTAALALRSARWPSDWLGKDYIDNSIPLLMHEAALFADTVTDWEIERYWSAS